MVVALVPALNVVVAPVLAHNVVVALVLANNVVVALELMSMEDESLFQHLGNLTDKEWTLESPLSRVPR